MILFDRTVRDALQLKAEKGGFSIESFDPESAGILTQIQRELVPGLFSIAKRRRLAVLK